MSERFVTVVRRLRLVERVCPTCGQPFVATLRRVYCTNSCAQRAAYRRHVEERRAARRERWRRQQQAASA